MTHITRRQFLWSAFKAAFGFTAGLLIQAINRAQPARKVPVVVPVQDTYARAVLATGPVVYPRRWAHLEDLQVVMPLRVAREE